MLAVPKGYAKGITRFALFFTKRVWQHVQILVIGAILTPGKRTVTAALRVMDLAHAESFQRYHRVLNRGIWSSLGGSRLPLPLLVHTLAPSAPLVMGLDDTLERRRGAKIQAKGIYRDPVCSSHSHMVQSQWVAVGEPTAVGPDPVGQAGLGLAVLDGVGTVRALSSEARPTAQEADRLGTADAPGGAALGAPLPPSARHQ